MGFASYLYLISFEGYLSILFDITLTLGAFDVNTGFFVYVILLIPFSFFMFFYNGKYDRIMAKFQNESESERKRGNYLTIVFLLFAYISSNLGLILKMLQNRGVF